MIRCLPLLLVLCALPALAQKPSATPLPTIAPSATPAAVPMPFLWKVDGPEATHYLLGSIHLLPESAHPLPENLEQAYVAAERLVLETDPDALASPEIQQRFLSAAHREPGTAAQRFGDGLAQKLKAQAQQSGLPPTVCDAYRAWFCALTLEIIAFQRAGFEAQYGIDQHFHERGIEDDKSFAFLEPTEQHLALFTGMNPLDGRTLLAETLDSLEAGSAAADAPAAMLAAWHADDLRSIEVQTLELRQHAPAIYARLMRDRNQAWQPQISGYFRSPVPTLVIVGAAHLPGPDGLIATLRAEGWNLAPVAAPADEPVAGPAAPANATDP
ncbi:MAG TPA: TraB/GumN family protein [Fontimonas sp.]